MQQNTINELIKQVEALVYYSQIHTVKGVQPVQMPDHETAWRKAQQWLWDNCKANEMGNYSLNEQPVEQKEKEAVLFGEWIRKHKYRPFTEGRWIVLESGDTKTTTQLYNEYQQQK